ncbi:MAG TPA: hypothetical protein VGA42_09300, partial [Gemmatimonadales bacterium]
TEQPSAWHRWRKRLPLKKLATQRMERTGVGGIGSVDCGGADCIALTGILARGVPGVVAIPGAALTAGAHPFCASIYMITLYMTAT